MLTNPVVQTVIALIAAVAAVIPIVIRVLEKILPPPLRTDFWDEQELADKTRFFVHPRCQWHDPVTGKVVEQDLFSALDRRLKKRSSRVILLLAGSGVGKTSALLKYWVEKHRILWGRGTRPKICVVRLENYTDALRAIREDQQKARTILFLDGLDEDLSAGQDLASRLTALIREARSYRNLLVSCRNHAMPSPPLRVTSEGLSWELERIHLLEFRPRDINNYLFRRFLVRGRVPKYFEASHLVRRLRDITRRPLILSQIEALAEAHAQCPYLYHAYHTIVQHRFERERVIPADLRIVCEELAIDLNVRRETRANADDLTQLTGRLGLDLTWWPVATRSLLTCDKNLTFYRFEHPSYLDFFVASRLLRDPTGLETVQMNTETKRFLCEGLARQWEVDEPILLDAGNLDFNGVGDVFKQSVLTLRSEQTQLPVVPEPKFYEALRNPGARPCLHLLESRTAIIPPGEAQNPPVRLFRQLDERMVLVDHATRLVWEQSGSDEELDRPMAVQYITYLNKIQFGGFAVWRLPTADEASSLLRPPAQEGGLHVSGLFDPVQSRIWCVDTTEDDTPFRVDFRRGVLERAAEEVLAAPNATRHTSTLGRSYARAVCSI